MTDYNNIAHKLLILKDINDYMQIFYLTVELKDDLIGVDHDSFTEMLKTAELDMTWWTPHHTEILFNNIAQVSRWQTRCTAAEKIEKQYSKTNLYTVCISITSNYNQNRDGHNKKQCFYNEYTGFVTTIDLIGNSPLDEKLYDLCKEKLINLLKNTYFKDYYDFLPTCHESSIVTSYDIIGFYPPPLKKGMGAFDFTITIRDIIGTPSIPRLEKYTKNININ